jgi:hypothetical protein
MRNFLPGLCIITQQKSPRACPLRGRGNIEIYGQQGLNFVRIRRITFSAILLAEVSGRWKQLLLVTISSLLRVES